MYVIKSGSNQYAADSPNGKITTVSCIDKAKLFTEKEKAYNVLATMPNRIKKLSSKWSIIEIPDTTETEDNKKSVSENLNSVDLDMLDKFNTAVKSAAEALNYMLENKKFYDKIHSKCDKEMQDVLHKIESSTFNACEGYKYAKLLREIRCKRRKAKDTIYFLKTIKEEFVTELNKVNIQIKSMENFMYKLRESKGLFE